MANRPSIVVMVPPEGFQYNHQTATSNAFQNAVPIHNIATKAMEEFTQMVKSLEIHGIQVLILPQENTLPDAVFPNNWFSTHVDKTGKSSLIIYPMLTTNRQAEVNILGLSQILETAHIDYDEIIDLRGAHSEILEGTGSLVLDKEQAILYACLSPRTSESLALKVAELLNYRPILFHSVDAKQQAIYHTNVIMSIAKDYAIICLESILDPQEKALVMEHLKQSNKDIIDISLQQMQHMCGNVLELFDAQARSLLILSTQALQHFTQEQLKRIQCYSQLVPVSIPTIETIGGGSARCMLAQIEISLLN
ncbi:MAG: hypothetical protein EPN84_07165 [Legionella sp.]|nr:MAG: hypothetical protein EPN84_07165 [Legionella sp.]